MCKRPEEQGEMAWLTVTCYGRPGKYVRKGIKRIWREHQKVSDKFYFRILCYKDIQPCAYAVIFVLVYIYIYMSVINVSFMDHHITFAVYLTDQQ